MAIDYIIDYDSIPKQMFGTDGILERLKGKERADAIIALFRRNGDQRPPAEMGFELERTAADGSTETQILVVQHLLDSAEELKPVEQHCIDCPANIFRRPFGCMGYIQYPISGEAEAWLLNQLPLPNEAPLVWLLLRQGVRDLHYDGTSVVPLRAAGRTHFAEEMTQKRNLGELTLTADQVFEMTFLLGNIHPNHAGILLLFFGAIRRDLEAAEIMQIGSMPLENRAQFDFLLTTSPNDDATIYEIKHFLRALYTAWRLNVPLLMDV
jgi:hypothetical protein